uniref:Transposon Ty3-I Gag-Pol polyprotein n=1 Tax=Cajanus cajan TaxID=3821 RepID=A0A151QUL1_CAJCA|nr:Transposon Ty3-I Gag-Pol polyprotein [Cajanus cajan]
MKTVVARYLVVNAQSSYSILIGRPTLNKLGAIVSTSHLKVKYPLLSGAVGTLKVDQEVARKCYGDSLKAQRKLYTAQVEQEVHSIGLDPRVSHFDRQLAPTEDIKEVTLAEGKKVKVGTSLSQEDAKKLVEVLKANMSAFAWHVKDMPRVDPDFMCHKLAIDPRAKPVIQKRRKFGENKRKAIAEETDKLLTTGFIREIQYPIWLANVVMVRKSSGKWRMCTDFTDLNKACPKDLYPLPNIDCLIDGALGYELLSFMDAYSGYNQIRVHPADEDKTAFIADQANYCYKVMPFGLKNAGATYQRLMDKVLVDQLGRNVEAYVDDMVVKSMSLDRHLDDLQELFKNVVCRYGVPQVLVSDNGTQFMSARVREFCQGIDIRMTFTSVEHPQSNGQAESANKIILAGLKRRVQDSGASWVEELPRVLWSYHTTVHSSTRDTPFNSVYGTDAMIPIEITKPSVRTTTFSEEESDQGRRVDLDLIAKTRERARINQVVAHRRAAFKYNTKVVPRDFIVGDLVLKRAQLTQMRNKLSPKWVGPYKIDEVVSKGAYRLRTLDGGMIPRTWNAANLRFYYS